MGDGKETGEAAASNQKQENGCVGKGLSEPMRTEGQTDHGKNG